VVYIARPSRFIAYLHDCEEIGRAKDWPEAVARFGTIRWSPDGLRIGDGGADRKVRSCWSSSDADGFGFLWFAQLDSDPMLELFAMFGDEDYSDYRLQKLDATGPAPGRRSGDALRRRRA